MGGELFSDVSVFWLVHLFLGIVVPLMIYWACCREDLGEQSEDLPK